MASSSKARTRDERLEARAIEQRQAIRLGAEDSRAFAEALLDPRAPDTRLATAADRYLRLPGD